MQGPKIYDGIDPLEVHPSKLKLMGVTVRMMQDAVIQCKNGDDLDQGEFEDCIGKVIATLAEMNAMIAEIVSEERGTTVGFTNVHEAETAITEDKIAKGLVSEDKVECVRKLNASLRAKLRGKEESPPLEEKEAKVVKV